MQALRLHYEGEAELDIRTTKAQQDLDTLVYTKERAMTFETLITRLNKAYNVLKKHGQDFTDKSKVNALARRIKNPNNNVTITVAVVGATFLLDPTKSPNNVATKATVVKRKTDALGIPIGTQHPNPLLDTREYEVELEDGTYDSFFANTIAENLWSQCDADGRQFNIIRGIIGHKTDGHAIPVSDGTYMVGGQERLKRPTAGWKINVEFSDGTTDWLPLRDVKESNPIDLAEYAVASKIDHKPAFKWWVPLVLRKRLA